MKAIEAINALKETHKDVTVQAKIYYYADPLHEGKIYTEIQVAVTPNNGGEFQIYNGQTIEEAVSKALNKNTGKPPTEAVEEVFSEIE